jgi:dimethylglycine dehydrogenase
MGYLHWKADLLTEFDPFETGLDRFVKLDKPAFVGKAALEARVAQGPHRQLVTLKLDSRTHAAHPGASLMQGDKVVGTVTSGGWGYRTGLNIAYAFVAPDFAAVGTQTKVDVHGSLVDATVIESGPYRSEASN